MKAILTGLLSLSLLGALSAVPAVTAGPRSDFALLDMEPGVADVSVQAGARLGSATHPKPAAFTVHITMTNRSDLGGTNGFVRVTYNDGDFVDYNIAAGATLQMTLAGGGTVGVDDIIKVTGIAGAVLIGQISLITEKGKPHPGLPGQDADVTKFCSTTAAP